MVLEFNAVMKKDELFKESFVSSWKKWGKAIVEYAKAIKSPPTGVLHALRECDDEGIIVRIIWYSCSTSNHNYDGI